MKIFGTVILYVLFFILKLQGQITLAYLHVNPNPFVSRTLATYSFSGTGTDTIGVYVTDMSFNVVKTIKSGFIVSPGFYQDSIIMDNFANGQYRVALTHSTTIFQSVAIIKDISASVKEFKSGVAFKIYPIPIKDKINFTVNSPSMILVNLKILNSLGQIVYSQNQILANGAIDVDFLNSGIYYLVVECNNEQKVYKIIK